MSNSPRLRCAIYTRKSSEEGLEQEFNSLDAQRDACEAFIASQAGLGWKLLADRYDDGGISGGTLARPALQRLLDDIRSGRVDVVVVYKIDRLTRSLTDFAKIVEVFDRRSVSFVSITQSFNTTSSMGRLTLNVLLSFAQFEREVTGERIRDKIAASKRKGMWMGGVVPLGYDVRDRKLVVNPGEAVTVRQLFALYLELGSIRSLQSRTQQLGLVTKRHVGADGVRRGGLGFSCGHLRAILTNPIYVGMIRQGKELHKGLHDPILDQQTFDLVRDRIAANANTSSSAAGADGLHLLTGLIFDETGDRLSPSHATKKGKRYRYYVSRRLVTSSAKGESKAWRLSAAEIEKVVQGELLQFLKSDTQLLDAIPSSSAASADLTVVLSAARATADELQAPSVDRRKELVTALIQKIVLNADCITIELIVGLLKTLGLKASEPDAASTRHAITIPIELRRRGIETRLVVNNKGGAEASAADPGLLDLLRQAHRLLGTLTDGSGLTIADLAERERMDVSDLSRVLRSAFLAPDICQAIIEGRQPTELTRKRLFRLSELPNLWTNQRTLLGF
ncbi:recombinase family protein [Mesorhizobium sp. M2E.F.Ca.ET.209.01.1.1]|uniref:recombinase family protein n=1 Tax=Mesorhizobium sp. M2E.F.Ca.ET.209.01.1.1 TaxID=2500526 RepID=UPI000FDBFBE8|nr:recombinase family protein [Mesorhizobium sp. M2E.F.Ca.ET.209.01.1.1]TGS09819.1 recombinase family protein [Mesorhizobium sp. M2E.F.Ca.ET.209.01.1.1]